MKSSPLENDLLTKAKNAWATRFRPGILRGAPLNPNAGVGLTYYHRLEALIDRMTHEIMKEVEAFFDRPVATEFFAEDASISSQARILTNKLADKFNSLFADLAEPIANQMVNGSNKTSSAALHLSLRDLSGGLSLPTTILTTDLKEILKATVAENVGLIKSIPSQYLDGVQGAFMRSITTGRGLADFVPYLEKHKGITLRRAKFIAMDQTRKTFNNLNKGRMEKLGLEEYEWLHSGKDRHPRPLHVAMSGKIYTFAKPPVIDSKTGERGIPGQLPGCTCRIIPVVKFRT